MLLKLHAELFGVSKPRIAGSIRHARVSILGSEHEPPATHDEVVRELNRLFAWYEDSKDTMHPVLLACLMKFRFVSIHPFEDGNGRISRLIMNHVLYHAGYPMFNIEYITRKGYYESLEVANKKRDEMAFVRWFFTRDIKANKDFA